MPEHDHRPDPERFAPVDPDPVEPTTVAGGPLHLRPWAVLAVFLGGAAGTAARYGLARLLPQPHAGWPTGTFVANAVGAFVLGFLLDLLLRLGDDEGWRQRLRLLVGTGFCGGLTTYSTFATESELLIRGGHSGLAAAYLAATVLTGLITAVVGMALAASIVPTADDDADMRGAR